MERRLSVSKRSGLDRIAPLALSVMFLLMIGACSGSTRYQPMATKVDGQTVFVIYSPPPCPKNASCAGGVIIDKQFYGLSVAVPKASYRLGPLFAVGRDQDAYLIPSVSTSAYRVLAVRTGSDWNLAFSAAVPRTDAFQRQICELTQDIPRDSYCVTHLGLTPTA